MADLSENTKDATIISKWSDEKYILKGADDYEDNLNTLDAFALGLDAVSRLFKAHDIPIPKALRDLRIDLRNFLIGGSSKYFRKDLFPNMKANRPKDTSSYMHLKVGCSVAISLLYQAKFGKMEKCAAYVLKKLDAHKINFKSDKRKPSTLIEWRKDIAIRKVNASKYYEYLVHLHMHGNECQIEKLDNEVIKGWHRKDPPEQKSSEQLIRNADDLILKTVLACPDLIKPVKTNRVD